MGKNQDLKNKDLRKRIVGLLTTVARHEHKIAQEIQKPAPNLGWVKKWEKDIDLARARVRTLEERLRR